MEKYKENFVNTDPVEFVLDEFTKGYAQCVDNNWNYSIFAQNPDVSIYQNEYNAGYVQGKVQTSKVLKATRRNTWSNFLIGSTPQDNLSIEVKPEYLEAAARVLAENYDYTYKWASERQDDPKAVTIIRLMYRMLGIFEGGADLPARKDVKFTDLDLEAMDAAQKTLQLDDAPLTFMDVYLLNAQCDLFDAIGDEIGMVMGYGNPTPETKRNRRMQKSDHCTAFMKKMPDGEIYWTHNSWSCWWAQSCALSYFIGEDFSTQNAFQPGCFGSNTDFGFNGHGICFNETTHVDLYDKTRQGIWIVWRSAAAEQFAKSIDEFYELMSLDNTGTYLNGYMVCDVKTGEMGLVEMSYNRFVLFRSDGTKLDIKDSTGYEPTKLDYDHHLITPAYIFGVNQPIYFWVGYELESMNLRPMRRQQLWDHIDGVDCMEKAKDLITFTDDPRDPLSVYGRWDLGYGTSEMHRYRPDGSMDAKCFSASEVKKLLENMSRKPAIDGQTTAFWMKYGTPHINGRPFIWSQSQFARFKKQDGSDCVPDAIDGRWNLVKLFMK